MGDKNVETFFSCYSKLKGMGKELEKKKRRQRYEKDKENEER
jgi:hypothetical protein